MLFKFSSFLFFCIFHISCLVAQVKMPLFFSDSMVLQQQTQAIIWGTDKPNTKIIVNGSWNKTSSTTTDENGKWKLQLKTPVAGGPYTLTINGITQVILKDVLIGEVWFCSGQSNMEMPMKGYLNTKPYQLVDSADYYIANSTNTNIRVFKPGWNPPSRTPLDYLTAPATWKSAHPSSTPDISAIAYFFAKKLQETLHVPVGIIVSARGGSSIESWLDSTTLASVETVNIPDILEYKLAHKTPTMMFNTFLNPYIGYTIKGIIWNQGEANRANYESYLEKFSKLIQSWRVKWNQGNFPFYFSEMPRAGSADDLKGVLFREAQFKTMLSVKKTGMAQAIDIPISGVHYPQKKLMADRLAFWALANDYHLPNITFAGPIYKRFEITNDNKINLYFDHAKNGLTSFEKPLTDFEIAGEDKVFFPAQAIFSNNTKNGITVWSDNVKNPVNVRYAFKNRIQGNLYNVEGFPAFSFRTDNW